MRGSGLGIGMVDVHDERCCMLLEMSSCPYPTSLSGTTTHAGACISVLVGPACLIVSPKLEITKVNGIRDLPHIYMKNSGRVNSSSNIM